MRAGDVIAEQFVLESEAASGGMGTVFRARDRLSNTVVAVKVLREDARFDREIAAIARLTHPGIVSYIAHGVVDGSRYLVMEWLDGEDLETRLLRGPLTEDETLILGRALAQALGAAHARGIIHRDVKPGNVRLCGGEIDRCKLVDFGIARLPDARTLTHVGEIIGTPGFMAPEQARGERLVLPAADIFSLGCLLYECLEGKPAFTGSHVIAILTKVIFEDVEPPNASPSMRDIVMRMMSKNAADRPADGNAAFEALSFERVATVCASPALGRAALELVSVIVTDDTNIEAARTIVASQSIDVLHVERLVGGARVAVVSSEAVAGDVARRAVRTALSLGRGVVATGRAIVGGRLPVGDVIDRAVRLLGEAKEGVRLDDTTASLVGARFELRFADGALYAMREHADEPVRTLLGRVPPCVGRDRETSWLVDLLRECENERKATCAIVTAPAGMGKSRLLAEFLARTKGLEVWIGRGDPMGAGSAFALVGQMLRRTAGIALGEPATQAQAKMLARAARTAQDARRVAEFLGEMAGVSFPADEGSVLHHARLDGQRMSDHMLTAWLDFVEEEARVQPVVIVLEDLHWGDATTVRLCDAALRVCRDQPLFVLALGRPQLRDAFPKLFEDRDAHTIAISPLGRRACESFVRTVMPDADDGVIAKIAEQAQGHPLLLEELVRARAEGRGTDTPESVMAILQARLALLAEPARRVLRGASIFGTSFWESAVAGLLGGAGDGKWLDHLVERDVIVRRVHSRFQGEKEYVFRHALVRDAAYLTLVPEDRALGHKLAGEWLEARGEHDAASLGEHFEHANDAVRACVWYHRAAQQAYDGGSLDEAIARANRAISSGATGETLGELRLLQAWAHYWRGQRMEQCERAREALQTLPERTERFFDALGVLCAGQQRADDIDGAIVTAKHLLDQGDMSVACGSIAAWMANGLRTYLRMTEADALCDLAEKIFELNPQSQVLAARIHYSRAVSAKFRSDLGCVLDETRATCAMWTKVGDRKQLTIASLNLGDALMHLGRYDEAETVLRGTLKDGERLGLLNMAITAQLNLGFVLARKGRADEGRVMLERVLFEYERRGDRFLGRVARAYLADVLRRLGDLDAAESHATKVLADAPMDPAAGVLARTTLAELFIGRGAHGDALEVILPAIEMVNRAGIEEGEARVRLAHATALLAAGETNKAREAARDARERILAEANKISDPSLRRSFLEDIDEHARTVAF